MRIPNLLQQSIATEELTLGAVAKLPSASLIEAYGDVGLDFVFLDYEHASGSPYDTGEMEQLVRAANLADIEPLVRIPRPEPFFVRKALETGVRSLLVPQVETAEEVRTLLKASKFEYQDQPGNRGIAGYRANSWGADMDNFLEREDQQTLLGVQIETSEAVQNLDEILQVPELGFVFIGHSDLAHSLGHGLDASHPEVQSKIRSIVQACTDANVPVGKVADSISETRSDIEMGLQIFLLGYELDAVREVFGRWVTEFNNE